MSEKPNYYSVLTAEVRYDNRLNDSEKLLFAEIVALSQANGVCWASNKYFSNLYGVSERSITRRIKNLEKNGHLRVVYEYKKGSKFIESRKIYINSKHDKIGTLQYDKTDTLQYDNSVPDQYDKIVGENTTSKSNTTSINKRVGKTRFSPPSLEEVTTYCLERNNAIDPQAFIDFYESKGWYIGKNKMKDWKSAIRTWERRDTKTTKPSKVVSMPVYSKDTGDESEAEALRKELSELWGKGETL